MTRGSGAAEGPRAGWNGDPAQPMTSAQPMFAPRSGPVLGRRGRGWGFPSTIAAPRRARSNADVPERTGQMSPLSYAGPAATEENALNGYARFSRGRRCQMVLISRLISRVLGPACILIVLG